MNNNIIRPIKLPPLDISSIFNSVNVSKIYGPYVKQGRKKIRSNYVNIDLSIKLYGLFSPSDSPDSIEDNSINSINGIKNANDIEDIIGSKWLEKKFGMTLQEFEKNFPEITL